MLKSKVFRWFTGNWSKMLKKKGTRGRGYLRKNLGSLENIQKYFKTIASKKRLPDNIPLRGFYEHILSKKTVAYKQCARIY